MFHPSVRPSVRRITDINAFNDTIRYVKSRHGGQPVSRKLTLVKTAAVG